MRQRRKTFTALSIITALIFLGIPGYSVTTEEIGITTETQAGAPDIAEGGEGIDLGKSARGEVTALKTISLLDDESITSYTINIGYGQTEARKQLDLVNNFRTDSPWAYDPNGHKAEYGDLAKLTYDYGLEKIAMQRAAELAFRYSHDRPNDEDCFSAYSDLYPNIHATRAGENIAYGVNMLNTSSSVFTAWREEDKGYSGQGHRRNMLNPEFVYIGVGYAKLGDKNYWVQEFSSVSFDAIKTAPADSTKTVTVKVLDSLVGNEVTIPETKQEFTGEWDFSVSGSITIPQGAKLDITGAYPEEYRDAKKKIVPADKKVATGGKKGTVKAKTPGKTELSLQVKAGKGWTTVSTVQIECFAPVVAKKAEITLHSEGINAKEWVMADEPVIGWYTSKPRTATVSEDGTVKPLKKGRVKIYPVFRGGRGSAYTKLTIKP